MPSVTAKRQCPDLIFVKPRFEVYKGSIRRECIDHVVVFGERHLRHVLLSYKDYYNATRTHLSLNKMPPFHRDVEWAGNVVCRPILGGLHHQYSRIDLR